MGLKDERIRILISEKALKERVKALAGELNREYCGKRPVFICLLKGSIYFFSDLTRQFEDHCELDFMAASSYGSAAQSSGMVKIEKDLSINVAGRHVIIVEDIIDTGLTLERLTAVLRTRGPASLKTVVLLDKPERRKCALRPDFTGFVIPDEFVVGYGLDHAQLYRNLPYIGVVSDEKG